jgi:transcriptional pleiotropic regulator of transition state genes
VILDKSGRILLPKEIRDKLGLREGTPLEVTVRGSEIVIRPYDKSLEERVEEAVKFLSENAPRAFVTQEVEEGDKWFSREYCLRKIGLKE